MIIKCQSCDSVGQPVRVLRLQLPAHHFHGDRKTWGKRRRCTGHTASGTVWYDRDCANAREGGCREGAAPPELSLFIAGCKDQNGCTGAIQKECSPHELLAAHDTQLQTWYGMTRTVQTQERGGAGGAQPPLNRSHYNVQFQCKLQRRLRPIFCDPQDHTLLVFYMNRLFFIRGGN